MPVPARRRGALSKASSPQGAASPPLACENTSVAPSAIRLRPQHPAMETALWPPQGRRRLAWDHGACSMHSTKRLDGTEAEAILDSVPEPFPGAMRRTRLAPDDSGAKGVWCGSLTGRIP